MSEIQARVDSATSEQGGDTLMEQLGQLPTRDLDELRSARLRHTARAAFAKAHRQSAEPTTSSLLRLYGALEPALVAALCVIYLGWALKMAIALHQ